MSNGNATARRTYGTGSILEKNGVYFGKWRVGDRQVKRKLGPVRAPASRDGLTKTMAEAKLRKIMAEVTTDPVVERITVEDSGTRLIDHLEALGRKPSTIQNYHSYLRWHLAPFFGGKALDRITRHDVEALIEHERAAEQSAKSILNYLGLLHSIFDYGQRRDWVTGNPCKLVDKPRAADRDADVRFLDQEELEALIRAAAADDLGRVEAVMYLTAAMTGMRQGELLALRWMDVDWLAHRVRVRRNFVRGEYGTPKSKRSTRSVPLADRVAVELEALSRVTAFTADDDLVFAHPHTGKPIDRSKLLKRYKAALKRAGVRELRFHDLRHTFGTRTAGAGVPLRTIQEWMGHRDSKTTAIYADYSPSDREAEQVEAAFGSGTNSGTNLSATEHNSNPLNPLAEH
ncbi:MAG: site-specific integrase [Thermoleophilaceae bacterium]